MQTKVLREFHKFLLIKVQVMVVLRYKQISKVYVTFNHLHKLQCVTKIKPPKDFYKKIYKRNYKNYG